MIKNYGHENLPKTPATEFGKDAYIVFVPPKNKYQDPTGLLVVRADGYALGLTVSAAEGKPAESVRPTLVAFGKAVLAKLD